MEQQILILCAVDISDDISKHLTADDFNFATADNILSLPLIICSTEEARRKCGCGRAFIDTFTHKATTIAIAKSATLLSMGEYKLKEPGFIFNQPYKLKSGNQTLLARNNYMSGVLKLASYLAIERAKAGDVFRRSLDRLINLSR